MHPDWQSFLQRNGAVVEHGAVQYFGNPTTEQDVGDRAVVTDLSQLALVRARGNDAQNFLQGQFTNDVRLLDDRRSQLGAYCSPKGRALAVVRFVRHGDEYHFSLPATLAEPTVSRLRKYVMMSKVTLDVLEDSVQIGYADPRGGADLRDVLGGEPPENADGVAHFDGISAIRLPGPLPRFQLFGGIARMEPLWERLAAQAMPVGAGIWERLDIEAGLPCVYPETTDAFVPQMLNLDLLGGISFKKGCYTGQEVVARTHYLGKLKRRMYRLRSAAAAPAVGTALFNTAMRADESAGSVVRAQPTPDGDCALLAVLQIEAVTDGELRLGSVDGPICSVVPLPYALENSKG